MEVRVLLCMFLHSAATQPQKILHCTASSISSSPQRLYSHSVLGLPRLLVFSNKFIDLFWRICQISRLMIEDSFNVEITGPEPDDEDQTQEPPQKKQKRFQCKHCQRFFARLEHLQRHERTRMTIVLSLFFLFLFLYLIIVLDTREKPFACGQCDSKFTRRYTTNRIPIL